MTSLLEIEFKGLRRAYFANPQEFPFQVSDMAVVQVEKGEDLGIVSHLGRKKGAEQPEESPAFPIVRKALPEDIEILQRNREKEKEALLFARRKAREHNLEMKFVEVELQWDGRKMTFFFTADDRIDFRELVKDFAATYRTRIDLRQIGARDETKKKGGYGICGRTLCCATWLPEFYPITTQMPRDQSLLLNPMRLSGVCGRLKCCLRYELETYREFLESCPAIDQKIVDAKKGEGAIEKLDMVHEQLCIRYENGETEKLSLDEFRAFTDWKRGMPKEQRITICTRPEPVMEREPPPPDTPSKESLASLVGSAEAKPKKEKPERKTERQAPAKAEKQPPSAPEGAKAKAGQLPQSPEKKSRRRHHRKRKNPPKSSTPS